MNTITEQNVKRRFYHVRESGRTPAYDLACALKQYVLEQRETEQLLSASRSASLDGLFGASPDTGSLNILEQEHHDIKQRSLPFCRNYQRDHFVIMEGTEVETAMAEQFFSGNGYRFIDAKTCAPDQKLEQYVRNLELFHSESALGVYARTKSFVGKPFAFIGRTVRRACNPLTLVAVLGIVGLPLAMTYREFRLENKVEIPALVVQDNGEIAGATYSFSTKEDIFSNVQSSQYILTSHLNRNYTNVLSYSISFSKYPALYIGEYDKGSIQGCISGDVDRLNEIREFVKGTVHISRESFTPRYKPQSQEKAFSPKETIPLSEGVEK